MKFSIFALLPVVGFFTAAVANPVAAPVRDVVEKRQDYSSEEAILQNLLTTVQGYTAQINSSVASGSASAASDLEVGTLVNDIIAAVNQATSQVSQLAKRDGATKRQVDVTTIVALLGSLFSELTGTINNAVNSLGLGSLLSILNPLGTALSQLLQALEVVVDDLLAVVKQLLDGILTGLSNALGGFDFGA